MGKCYSLYCMSLQPTPPAHLQQTLPMTVPDSAKRQVRQPRQRCSAVNPHVGERGSCCSCIRF
ncbi:hypothetical protein V8C42DRAFT_323368 [Trichoderma barbatum]